jgi:flagella basal body P-ring formation protein FlgA
MNRAQRNFDSLAAVPVAVLIATLALPASAQPTQAVEEVRQAAAGFVQQRMQTSAGPAGTVHVEAGALDARLRLAPCTQPLQAFSNAELRPAPRLVVGVRCAQPAWTIYVPVQVETELEVLVLQRALPRSSAVLPLDVKPERRRVPGVAASYILDASQLAGRHLRNTAAPGTALTVDLLAADLLVRRGQRVTLIATAGGIEVRAQGEAVSDAMPDGRVRVLNLNSQRVVEGRVESRDSVRVSL